MLGCGFAWTAASPPRHHQSRGRASSRARAQRQPALRGHQPQALAPRSVRSDLLRRGDIENRIKALHHGLEIKCTSCNRFLANHLRGLLSAPAYVLYQELRLRADRTASRSAQVSTLREHLMKLGAWVESSVRRIVLHLPATCSASQRLADPRPQSWRCAHIALSGSRRALHRMPHA